MTTKRKYPGFFIVVEGIDGCGSTTHSKLLSKALRGGGRDVVHTFEPTGGPIGGLIRQVLQHRLFVPDVSGPRTFAWSTMALLFAADRLDHLDSKIVPALRDGAIVISDRYDLSSVAYQSATAPSGTEVVPWIRELNSCALRPDLTIVINVPLEVAEERRRNRGGVEEVFENRAIQERLVKLYEKAEELLPGDPFVHVSGVGEQPEVAARIMAVIREALPALELPPASV
jgi:dTMP kinase